MFDGMSLFCRVVSEEMQASFLRNQHWKPNVYVWRDSNIDHKHTGTKRRTKKILEGLGSTIQGEEHRNQEIRKAGMMRHLQPSA